MKSYLVFSLLKKLADQADLVLRSIESGIIILIDSLLADSPRTLDMRIS